MLLSFHWFLVVLTCLLMGAGLCIAHAAMVVRLTEEAKKVNDAELKIFEMDRAAQRLSE